MLCLSPALRDNRIQLHHSTATELSITISEVQLSDEGEYTCSLFTMPVRTARATVTVLGGSHVQAFMQVEKLHKSIKIEENQGLGVWFVFIRCAKSQLGDFRVLN